MDNLPCHWFYHQDRERFTNSKCWYQAANKSRNPTKVKKCRKIPGRISRISQKRDLSSFSARAVGRSYPSSWRISKTMRKLWKLLARSIEHLSAVMMSKLTRMSWSRDSSGNVNRDCSTPQKARRGRKSQIKRRWRRTRKKVMEITERGYLALFNAVSTGSPAMAGKWFFTTQDQTYLLS